MNVGSLFSGIGGLDLGLERAGMHVAWQCEADPWCRAVLRKHWPLVPCFDDVRAIHAGDAVPVDLICGGFPCQPVSAAGRRLAFADERWLWPEFERVVRLLRPRYVLVENVPGLLSRPRGFDRAPIADVVGGLASLGYDAEWDCIPASAVGAPHRRDRVWLVAYPERVGRERREDGDERRRAGRGGGAGELQDVGAAERGEGGGDAPHRGVHGRPRPLADAGGEGPQGAEPEPAGGRPGPAVGGQDVADAEEFAERPGLRQSQAPALGRRRPCDGGGAGDHWLVEPDVGRVAHGVSARVDRLRALGNACVPQVAEWVGRQIMNAHHREENQ